MKRSIYILILLLSIMSCKHNDRIGNNIVEIDPTTIKQTDIRDFFAEIKAFRLNGADTAQVGTIDNILEDDGKLFILDKTTMSIFIFTSEGEFIKNIEKRGRGPKEYLETSNLSLDKYNKELYLTDNRSLKTFVMDYDGQFKRVLENDFVVKQFVFLSANTCILVKDKVNSSLPNGYIINMYVDGKLDKQYLNYTYEQGQTMFDYYSPVTVVNDSLVFYQTMFDNNIRSISNDEFTVAYQIEFTRDGIPEHILKESSSDIGLFMIENNWEYACNPYVCDIIDNNLLFSFITNGKQAICSYDLENSKYNVSELCLGNVPLMEITPGMFYLNHNFFCVSEQYRFDDMSEQNKNTILKKYPEIFELLNEGNYNDNPVIIKMSLK